jgi:hypothetical protein
MMDSQYSFWLITSIVGLMIAALAWFIKRLVGELEAKIARSDKATANAWTRWKSGWRSRRTATTTCSKQLRKVRPPGRPDPDEPEHLGGNREFARLIINALRDREGPKC